MGVPRAVRETGSRAAGEVARAFESSMLLDGVTGDYLEDFVL